jgi:hypothetical protein
VVGTREPCETQNMVVGTKEYRWKEGIGTGIADAKGAQSCRQSGSQTERVDPQSGASNRW